MYLLFISHECGEHQNSIYPTIGDVHNELQGLADTLFEQTGSPKLVYSTEYMNADIERTGEHFAEFDDGTWYSVYRLNWFEIQKIKDHINHE